MKLLFIGDIFATTGKRVLADYLKGVIEKHSIDFTIANGENLAGGRGITKNLLKKLKSFGVDCVTSGNHIWDNKDGVEILSSKTPPIPILRPCNYPDTNQGIGHIAVRTENDINVGIISVQGRVFMDAIDCPFKTAEKAAKDLARTCKVILVDFHAEATSEKIALARFLDGKISALIGTHTHVQTADERIFPNGTAYLSDAGMTGPHDSIIGMNKESVIKKFVMCTPHRFEPAKHGPELNGVIIDVDETTGNANSIERINIKYENFCD